MTGARALKGIHVKLQFWRRRQARAAWMHTDKSRPALNSRHCSWPLSTWQAEMGRVPYGLYGRIGPTVTMVYPTAKSWFRQFPLSAVCGPAGGGPGRGNGPRGLLLGVNQVFIQQQLIAARPCYGQKQWNAVQGWRVPSARLDHCHRPGAVHVFETRFEVETSNPCFPTTLKKFHSCLNLRGQLPSYF